MAVRLPAIPIPFAESYPFIFLQPVMGGSTFRLGYYIPARVRARYGTRFWAGFGIGVRLYPSGYRADPNSKRGMVAECLLAGWIPVTPTGEFGVAVMRVVSWGEAKEYRGFLKGYARYYNGEFKPITGWYKVLGLMRR